MSDSGTYQESLTGGDELGRTGLDAEGLVSPRPYECIHALQAQHRVLCPTRPGPFAGVVLHRDDVEYLSKRPKEFLNRTSSGGPIRLPALDYEGEEHARHRRLLDPMFGPKTVVQWEDQIAAICDEVIDGFIDRGHCDFTNEFAFTVPARMFLRLMGVPMSHVHTFTGQDLDPAERGNVTARIYTYIEEALAERSEKRGDDILSRLLDFELEGDRLTHEEVLGMGRLLFLAGLDTVNSALQLFFGFLATSPPHRRRLVEEPEIIPSAIEELLRWSAPVAGLTRVAAKDAELAGIQLSEGDRVAFSLLGANHDLTEFDDSGTVDFDRNPNRHFAFGVGGHRCAGSHFARLELRVALERWHARIPEYTIRPGTEPRYNNTVVRHVDLELAWPRP
jgi:cytochrome P450